MYDYVYIIRILHINIYIYLTTVIKAFNVCQFKSIDPGKSQMGHSLWYIFAHLGQASVTPDLLQACGMGMEMNPAG